MFAMLGKAIRALGRSNVEARFEFVEKSLDQKWTEGAFEELRRLAAGGRPDAQYRLGRAYEQAEGVVQNISDAVYWYRLAADQGNLPSQVRLGLIYFIEPPRAAGFLSLETDDDRNAQALRGTLSQFFPHGTAVQQDLVEALKWNRLAAEQGSADAQARMGHQLALGLGTDSDLVEAEKWFAAAAAQFHSEGELGLGLVHAGTYGTVTDLPLAAHWLALSAEHGNRIAEYGYGKLLLHGEGVAKDAAAAVKLLESSSEQGYAPATYLLGMIYWQGEGVPVDLGKAETWLRRSAIRSHGEGSCALAQMLLDRPDDDGVESAALLREQAELGNKRAAGALSELYAFGRGVPRDAKETARWRKLSESENRPETLTMLASLHAEGISVDQDFATAASLLKEAADQGNVDALYNLGWLHWVGKGVPFDREAAAYYFREAARLGSTEASFQLGLLYSETGEAQAQEAAFASFTTAADAGHLGARANVALLTAEGLGVEPDPVRALELLEGAAESGSVSAQSALGFRLAAGISGAPDIDRGRPWLEKAAAGGDVDAQAWMGDVHRLGLFAPADYAEAELWYRRAAGQGHVGSIVLLASAIDSMAEPTTETRAEAFGLWLAAASAGDALAQTNVGRCYRNGEGCEVDLNAAFYWFTAAANQGVDEAQVSPWNEDSQTTSDSSV